MNNTLAPHSLQRMTRIALIAASIGMGALFLFLHSNAPLLKTEDTHAPSAESNTPASATLLAEWTDPDSGERRFARFPGDALIVCPAEDRVLLALEYQGTPVAFTQGLDESSSTTAAVRAPAAPGSTTLKLHDARHTIDRRLCIVVPSTPNLSHSSHGTATIGAVTLGQYYNPARSGTEKVRTYKDAYQPPAHFLPINDQTAGLWISATLTTDDLCQPSESTGTRHCDWAPVNYRLWDAVDAIRFELERLRPGARLHLISVFRAPSYNRSIGSGRYGRHCYGDAIDFVIDTDGDGFMDDLTADGKVDQHDGLWMVALIERMMAEDRIPLGGIGVYHFARSRHEQGERHPLTMHLDLRGHRARWAFHHTAGGRRREFSWESRDLAAIDLAEAEQRKKDGRPALPQGLPLPILPCPERENLTALTDGEMNPAH